MMCELTLEAAGYRPDEAAIVRRIHDLIYTPAERAQTLRSFIEGSSGRAWRVLDTAESEADERGVPS